MSKSNFSMALTLIGVLAGLTGIARAQSYQRAYRLNDKQVETIIHSIENGAKSFRSSLDNALDQSRLDGTILEDNINARIKDFEGATKQLHDHFDSRQSAAGDVQNVLDRASRIDEFMRRNRLDSRAQNDWLKMKNDLDRLANAYSVTWRWQPTYLPVEVQPRPYRVSDKQVERLLRNSEKAADAFRGSLDRALDRSRLDGTAREDDINQFVKEFNDATRQLRDRFNGRASVAADVESVLNHAGRIDLFMRRHPLDRRAQSNWLKLRNELDQLSRAYNVMWDWSRTY
ncbi:MAG: hypothetical protein WAL47_15000 [Pyrinomonadaceae bacterium]